MKKNIFLLILLLISFSIFANPVNEITAKKTAIYFLSSRVSPLIDLKLSDLSLISSKKNSDSSVYYYVFAIKSGGFILIAGDDDIDPVLGYSLSGEFKQKELPQSVVAWLGEYESKINYVVKNKIKASKKTKAKWSTISGKGADIQNAYETSAAVAPLMTTKWNQSPYYNDLCPYDYNVGERTVTGCVATAMAQVMKFWNFPPSGTGFYSYDHPKYGAISTNFSNNQYLWDQMPDEVNQQNEAVARLMYDIGVSVEMSYDVAANGGSGAYVVESNTPVPHCSEYALKTYFGYNPETIKGLERENYTDTQWVNLLKTELSAGRPILYAGFGGGGGHAFVCDGVDKNNFFHINWGWGGQSDGYFNINSFDPESLGTGGGDGGFTSGHQAVVGVQPLIGSQKVNLAINGALSTSDEVIEFEAPFSVSGNITNYGTENFVGDLSVGVFDAEGNFVTHVTIIQGIELPADSTFEDPYLFQTEFLEMVFPGDYTLSLLYRPLGGIWDRVDSTDQTENTANLQVINSSPIVLSSELVVEPSPYLIKNQPATVTVTVKNTGTTTFTGQYAVIIYNKAGDFVDSFDNIIESAGLRAGRSKVLNFTTQAIVAEPGSYEFALAYIDSNDDVYLAGAASFSNPSKVIVSLDGLAPDEYEPNNDIENATTGEPEIQGDTFIYNAANANCHTGVDYDYYKIDLDKNKKYSVSINLKDLYTDSANYTLDAMFTYSFDGQEWSEVYDDTLSELAVENADLIYIKVSPYFTGSTGTYSIESSLTDITPLGVSDHEFLNGISIYPNPVVNELKIQSSNADINEIIVHNALGNQLLKENVSNSSFTINTTNWSTGIYLVSLKSAKGIVTKKIIK